MTRQTHPLLRVSIGLLAVGTLACGGGPTPPPNLSGDLIVHFTTPNANDRAVQLALTCDEPPTSLAGKPGYDVYKDLGKNPIPLIVIRQGGQSISSTADIVSMAVADTTKRCTANLQSVAYQGYGVRLAPSSGYKVTVSP